ncbi:MAG: ribosomal protein S18-alanine N-acetyltransferase [Gammaproteobacteria bacterium]|nr:ribosomal protein S18-alanine N-acetyltransferase [Gammaproteobacteria bacterium]
MIRSFLQSDIPQALPIEEATQIAPWSEVAFLRCFEAKYPGWVIEDQGQVVGFVLLSLAVGECHILNLCIHPKAQRRGFGRQLMEYALDWAKEQGAGIVYLEVRRSNLAAILLYQNMHFKQIGERKDYYPAGRGREDALVFARDIGIEVFLEKGGL